MKKALIIGINYYNDNNNLNGCVNDAISMADVLSKNQDESKNFDVRLITAEAKENMLTIDSLKELISELFKDDEEIVLFYFSGHGSIDNSEGCLVTSDCEKLEMKFIMDNVNQSKAKNKILIIDSCFSGQLGNYKKDDSISILKEGVTILTASTKNQYSFEFEGTGVFTNLFVDALNGSAADLLGNITPGSIYAHIDQSLGSWQQRPVFKTNVKNFVTLRKVKASIELTDLRKIVDFFPDKDFEYPSDPSYEPESENPDKNKTIIFSVLQKYNRINLLIPKNAPHMYHAAIKSKSCELTPLGKHYWSLFKKQQL